jgi:hypothetical protein
MGEVIMSITQTNPDEQLPSRDLIIESEIAERVVVDHDNVKQLGEKSIYACPLPWKSCSLLPWNFCTPLLWKFCTLFQWNFR